MQNEGYMINVDQRRGNCVWCLPHFVDHIMGGNSGIPMTLVSGMAHMLIVRAAILDRVCEKTKIYE